MSASQPTPFGPTSSSGIAAMIRRIDAAVAGPDSATVCQGVKSILMEELGNRRVTVPDEYLRPVDTGYARRRLFLDPHERYSIVVMVWAPGQHTPLHDHAGHWCVECVYEGRVRVTSFAREGEGGDRVHFTQKTTVVSGVGAAGALIPPFEYHTIENPFTEKAVTVHVYRGEITWCHAFEPLGDDGWFLPQRHDLGYDA